MMNSVYFFVSDNKINNNYVYTSLLNIGCYDQYNYCTSP